MSTQDDHPHCGNCRYANWPKKMFGPWDTIRGNCDHPRLRLMPRANPMEIKLGSGRECRYHVAGGVTPERSVS